LDDTNKPNFAWDTGDHIAILTSDGQSHDVALPPYLVDHSRAKVEWNSSNGTRADFAFYPNEYYDRFTTNSGGYNIYYNLPSYYDLTDKSGDWSPLPLYAENDDESNLLSFRHICALMRINCNNIPVGTQYIRVSHGSEIWGSGLIADCDFSTEKVGHLGDSDHIDYKIANSALSSRASNVVLNVPLPASNDAGVDASYSSFTVSALGSDQATDIQDVNLAANLTNVQPGQGFHRGAVFMPVELNFGGGTKTDGSIISKTQESSTYYFALSEFLNEDNRQILSSMTTESR